MRKKLRPTALNALCVIATAATASAAPSLEPGVPFPLIPLPLIDRTEGVDLHTVADFRGHKAVVHIFAGW